VSLVPGLLGMRVRAGPSSLVHSAGRPCPTAWDVGHDLVMTQGGGPATEAGVSEDRARLDDERARLLQDVGSLGADRPRSMAAMHESALTPPAGLGGNRRATVMVGLNPWRGGVLAIDESSACGQAIRFCAAAPGRLASEVTILHIAQPAGGPAGVDTARGRRLAAAAACRMARAGVLPRSHVSIAAGRDVPLAIADACTSADLVIIGVGRDGPAVGSLAPVATM
jgi:hypothetical protein